MENKIYTKTKKAPYHVRRSAVKNICKANNGKAIINDKIPTYKKYTGFWVNVRPSTVTKKSISCGFIARFYNMRLSFVAPHQQILSVANPISL